jgi:hypothetical protein
MQITANVEMAAPERYAWSTIVHPELYETQLRDRGLPVARHPAEGEIGVGTRWSTRVGVLGAMRDLDLEVAGLDPPHRIALQGNTLGVKITAELTLTKAGEGRCRLNAMVGFSQTSFGGRALLISLRLAEGKLQHRLESQLVEMAGRVETRFCQVQERQLRRGSAG